MNAQMSAKPRASRRPVTLFGFLAGLVLGLGIAAAAAVYLTKAPLPFVNKVQRSTENVTPDPVDPNHALYSPHIPTAAAPPLGTAPAAETGAGSAPATGTPKAAGADAGAPAAVVPAAPVDAAPRLMLQVGAYKSVDDADAARARLALLGLDGKVTEVQLDGVTLYRVRLGPYGQLDDLNGIRRTLSENGMEPQLVHAR
jgi:cell division protein FtsN